ncbi:hypothetical protein GCM10017687_28460 [Streptomyces echinatus]
MERQQAGVGWQCKVPSARTPALGEGVDHRQSRRTETRFHLPTNGVRPQPMVERANACAILRLVEGNRSPRRPGLP